jgi:hypothetical protein
MPESSALLDYILQLHESLLEIVSRELQGYMSMKTYFRVVLRIRETSNNCERDLSLIMFESCPFKKVLYNSGTDFQ